MRIAIVTESFLPTLNGVSQSVACVTRELERLGHHVLIIAPGQGESLYSQTPIVRVPGLPVPGYRHIPLGMPTSQAYGALRAFRPDVVHVAGPLMFGAWGLYAAKRLGVPGIGVYQTDIGAYMRHYRLGLTTRMVWQLLRDIHHLGVMTLAPSSSAIMNLHRHGIHNVRLWGRGVDATRFNPIHRSEQVRASLGVRQGELLLGYVGRLAPEKHVTMLRAISHIPKTRLVIIGDGPQRHLLRAQLAGSARILGPHTGHELASLYAALDIFVHTGPVETFGQTIQEAQASGVVPIAPASGGPLDLIRHTETGLLYRPRDKAALRATVRWLVAHDQARQAMAATAVASVQDTTWAKVTRELVGHYEDARRRFTAGGQA